MQLHLKYYHCTVGEAIYLNSPEEDTATKKNVKDMGKEEVKQETF